MDNKTKVDIFKNYYIINQSSMLILMSSVLSMGFGAGSLINDGHISWNPFSIILLVIGVIFLLLWSISYSRNIKKLRQKYGI